MGTAPHSTAERTWASWVVGIAACVLRLPPMTVDGRGESSMCARPGTWGACGELAPGALKTVASFERGEPCTVAIDAIGWRTSSLPRVNGDVYRSRLACC